MTSSIHLQSLLSQADDHQQQSASFALLCLGIVESLNRGAVGANEAVRLFFSAENCLYVRNHLHDQGADELMSRGVQLPDLFDALPAEDAQRGFQRELNEMHALCLRLLEDRPAAV